ncbi:MAG: class I SAM-dependent methyltransferase [Methanothrix sp.]
MKASYDSEFYLKQKEIAHASGREIIPHILEFIKPKSVLDVGCGVGSWLHVFNDFGIEDVFGIDGDWIDKNQLEIPIEKFLAIDLSSGFDLSRTFDLVISLEVAEHIHEDFSDKFIESLINHGPIILFSAAVPLQGGIHHVNEQWPEYWVEKFKKNGYLVVDAIRPRIWQNRHVDFWYAQNLLIFVRSDCMQKNSLLDAAHKKTNMYQLSIIHPMLYMLKAEKVSAIGALPILSSILPRLEKSLFLKSIIKKRCNVHQYKKYPPISKLK